MNEITKVTTILCLGFFLTTLIFCSMWFSKESYPGRNLDAWEYNQHIDFNCKHYRSINSIEEQPLPKFTCQQIENIIILDYYPNIWKSKTIYNVKPFTSVDNEVITCEGYTQSISYYEKSDFEYYYIMNCKGD